MWPILGWRRTLLCRRPSRVFCSELRRESWWHDHAERHHRKTTYQGRSADLSFLLARITNLSHEQLRRLDGLISHMDYKTVFLTAICLANLFLFSVFFFQFLVSICSLLLIVKDLCVFSLPLLIFTTLSSLDVEPGKLPLPHRRSLWYFLCLPYSTRSEVALLSCALNVSHMSSIQPRVMDECNMGHFLSLI